MGPLRVFGFAAVFVSAVGAIVALTVALTDSGRPAVSDAETVYCLAPANADGLAQAAAALGLAGADSATHRVVLADRQKLTPSDWHAARPADFARACAALSAPQFTKTDSGGGNSITTALTVLIQVGGGALLTLLIDNYRIAAERGRADAAALRAAWDSFRRQVTAYAQARVTAGPQGIPSFTLVQEQREDVESALRVVATRHPRWDTPNLLTRQLRDGLLGDTLADADRWPSGTENEAQRQSTLGLISSSLDTTGDDLVKVATTLETPIRLGRKP